MYRSVFKSTREPEGGSPKVPGVHRVQIVIYPGTALFSIAAYLAVFERATGLLQGKSAYQVSVASSGPHQLVDALSVLPHDGGSEPTVYDTLVITGPDDIKEDLLTGKDLVWLRNTCARSRRVVASGSGTFLFAATGLLGKHKAVVHGNSEELFGRLFPKLLKDGSKLYTEHKNIYTCAGAAADLDCALKLVEEDFGCHVAGEVAKELLLQSRRPGDAPQVSNTLQAQTSASSIFSELLAWIPDNLSADLSVKALARRAAMSPRNFARVFHQQLGTTPARYVEHLRFEAAHCALQGTEQSVSQAAALCGFRNLETLRRLFVKRVGMTPGRFRRTFGREASCSALKASINERGGGISSFEEWVQPPVTSPPGAQFVDVLGRQSCQS